MKIPVTIMLFLSLNASANNLNVYKENNMLPVTKDSPREINNLGSGVCQVDATKEMRVGCTCFRIKENIVITNYHCLPSMHSDLKELYKMAPVLGSPTEYLYHLVNNSSPEILNQQLLRHFGRTDFILPKNDSDLILKMNQTSEKLGYINFNHTIDREIVLEDTSIKIEKVLAMSEKLDVLVFKVSNIPKENKILEISDVEVKNGDQLLVIGHPYKSPFEKMAKVYDNSSDCKVFEKNAEDINLRTHNFSHGCDTYNGNSGSPIFNINTQKVVGLHWSGFNDSPYNRAIKMTAVNKFIKTSLIKRNLKEK